jgi:thymidylate synthase (FAD)
MRQPKNTTLVLDHGYVRFIESWGSDERIIEAARMSTNKGFMKWGGEPDHSKCPVGTHTPDTCLPPVVPYGHGDEHLLRYLYEHQHMTPFEMAGMVIEVQAPIFVFREWHRHRTQSYNEMSARYVPLPDLNYVPTVERLLINASGTNRQANRTDDSIELTRKAAEEFIETLTASYEVAECEYQSALEVGVPKELARLVIPAGRYSRMRASANLRNWLGFLALRTDKAAQWEIRQYANTVADLLSDAFPRTYALFAGEA